MRNIVSGIAIFCVAATLSAGASAQEKVTETQKLDRTRLGREAVPPGGAQLPEEVLRRFVDEPSLHFESAQERFLKKDGGGAATELRKSAAFVRLEAARTTAEDGKALVDAADALERLAGDVEKGSIGAVDALDGALAQAELALARHHQSNAERYWQANDDAGAGHDLKAASSNLRNALKYVGAKADAEVEGAIKDAAKIGQDLLDGNSPPDERIGASIERLGSAIDNVGARHARPEKQ